MSNARRGFVGNAYRTQYLRSAAWYTRRTRWFHDETAMGWDIACAACGRPARDRDLELHHTDYTGVTLTRGHWHARETHDDLLPLHPYCHELLHRLIDRDRVLAKARGRRDATRLALTALRHKLAPPRDPQLEEVSS